MFDKDYPHLFDSYEDAEDNRGELSRPTVKEIMRYRGHVDKYMTSFLKGNPSPELDSLITLGPAHEQRHQELLLANIKYILGSNPLFPAYGRHKTAAPAAAPEKKFIPVKEGLYEIGHQGDGFCFDNELHRHKTHLRSYSIATSPVTNREYLEFMDGGGYQDCRYWHADGWKWAKKYQVNAPLYWHKIRDKWIYYTWQGLGPVDPEAPVCHISYYEAAAFAAWKHLRLPMESEWEAAAGSFPWGQRWEWTESAYPPYSGFERPTGIIGEYPRKFMINQMVLRGASEITPPGHSRITYRNFFRPHLRWQYTGIRLAGE